MSVVFLPAGIAIGLLGVLILGAGVFGHILSPLGFSDLMDAVIGLAGAAIAMTFTVAIFTFAVGFPESLKGSTPTDVAWGVTLGLVGMLGFIAAIGL